MQKQDSRGVYSRWLVYFEEDEQWHRGGRGHRHLVGIQPRPRSAGQRWASSIMLLPLNVCVCVLRLL